MTPLCIDARWLHTGIGAYTFNLVREISYSGEFDLHVLAYRETRLSCSRTRGASPSWMRRSTQ